MYAHGYIKMLLCQMQAHSILPRIKNVFINEHSERCEHSITLKRRRQRQQRNDFQNIGNTKKHQIVNDIN